MPALPVAETPALLEGRRLSKTYGNTTVLYDVDVTVHPGKVLALVAVVIFVLASLGAWPDDVADDVEPVALGLAFLAASFVVP